jgi:uncharacterized protein (TIGR04255 family)
VYVVAQVRFSAVESIPKYIPALQDEFRKQFPRFTKGETRSIRISPVAPPEISVAPRFEFQNKERTCGIVVQSDSVSVHVSRYSSFDLFCSTLQYALDTVHSAVTLGLIDRIGLRYINMVRPAEEEDLAKYLHQGLLGLNDIDVGVSRSIRMSAYQGETEVGTLRFRLEQRNDGGILPPDVEPSSLSHGQPTTRPGEVLTLLDFDHFREFTGEPLDFSTEAVIQYLWRLHDNTDLAFRAAVTKHALHVWDS